MWTKESFGIYMRTKGLINRYNFISSISVDKVVLILRKSEYYVYGDSELILDYIKFKGSTLRLRNKHISYIVVEGLDIVYEVNFSDNMYKTYLMRASMKKFMGRLSYNLRQKNVESHDVTIKEETV